MRAKEFIKGKSHFVYKYFEVGATSRKDDFVGLDVFAFGSQCNVDQTFVI